MKSVALRRGSAFLIAAMAIAPLAISWLATPVTTVQAAIAPCGIQWGAYETNTPWDSTMSGIRALDNAINRHSTIIHYYAEWGDQGSGQFSANQPWMLQAVRNYSSVGATGATPLITWEAWAPPYTASSNAYPLKSIAAGQFDGYIDSWAQGLKGYGGPVMLDVFHEMDGNWYPWGYNVNGNTPADLVAAYRHVHDRFAAAGASNVQFVWNPNYWNYAGVDQRVFYPGDAYVSWLAIDAYNWGAGGGTWEPLANVLSVDAQIYQRVTSLNASKPIMLAEWASVEPVAGDPAGVTKGAWIQQAAADLGSKFPRITAVVWFSEKGTPFALDSSSNSIAGAKAGFGACGSPAPPPPPPSPSPSPPPPPPQTPKPTPTSTPASTPSSTPRSTPSATPTSNPLPTYQPTPTPTPTHPPAVTPPPTPRSTPTATPKVIPPPALPPKPRPTSTPGGGGGHSTTPAPKPPSSAPPAASSRPVSPAKSKGAPSPQAVLAAFNTNDPGLKVLELGIAFLIVGWVLWRVFLVVAAVRRWARRSAR